MTFILLSCLLGIVCAVHIAYTQKETLLSELLPVIMMRSLTLAATLSSMVISASCARCSLTTPQGESYKSMMLTGWSCNITILVVGGGGRDDGATKFGGAGSGYLQYLSSVFIEHGTHISAQVCTMHFCWWCLREGKGEYVYRSAEVLHHCDS